MKIKFFERTFWDEVFREKLYNSTPELAALKADQAVVERRKRRAK